MRVFKQETALKIVISGLILEKWHYLDSSIGYGSFEDCYEEGKQYKNDTLKEDKKYALIRNEINRKRRFERLVNANIDTYPKPQWQNPFNSGAPYSPLSYYPPVLLTLTYEKQQEDLSLSKGDLNLFIKRLNYNLDNPDLKYLAVPELTKQNRIHFHNLFFNLPYVKKEHLAECWGNGFIDVRRVDRVKSMGRYMVKYLRKGFRGDSNKTKTYLSSKNLKKPITLFNQEITEKIAEKLPDTQKIFKKSYYSIWHGNVDYSVYRLPVDNAIAPIIKT